VSVLINRTGPFTVSGVVTDQGGVGLGGTVLTLNGAAPVKVVAAADGTYSFTGLTAGGNFTVTPAQQNYSFTPPQQSFDNISANQLANFSGTLLRYNISGLVRDASGAGVGGVTVTLSGAESGAVTTASDGRYTFASLPRGGNYTVTPSLTRYVFTPQSRNINNLSANQTVSFGVMLATFTISGSVRDTGTSNVGLANATVTLSGTVNRTSTTADGNYSFTGLPVGGNYTVTVSQTDAAFTNFILTPPLTQTFNALSANQTANFSGKRLSVTVGLTPKGVALGDFNRDGRLDAVLPRRLTRGGEEIVLALIRDASCRNS